MSSNLKFVDKSGFHIHMIKGINNQYYNKKLKILKTDCHKMF